MAAIGRAEYVAKCPRIGHVLGDERYFVHWMVVQGVARSFITEPQSVDGDIYRDSLLVLAGRSYRYF